MPAEVKILVEGYTTADAKAENRGEEKTCATISLIRDKDLAIVVDPGVLESQQILIDALKKERLALEDVDVVCITHSHIDHYRNIGMFKDAKALDYFGLWNKNACEEWREYFTPNIQILKTPGHDYTSITLFVSTDEGVDAVCGDGFWKENYPKYDVYALDPEKLENSRHLVLRMADWIVPGHAGMYENVRAPFKEDKEQPVKKSTDTQPFCRKCHRPMQKNERCLCQPSICIRCCECNLDCDLCGCSHKRK